MTGVGRSVVLRRFECGDSAKNGGEVGRGVRIGWSVWGTRNEERLAVKGVGRGLVCREIGVALEETRNNASTVDGVAVEGPIDFEFED